MCVSESNITPNLENGATNMARDQHPQDAHLRQVLQQLDATQAQEIRDAYYKAIEGLQALAQVLELADADQTENAGPLLTEHFHAVAALAALQQSRLGRIL